VNENNEANEMNEVNEMHVRKGIHAWSERCDANAMSVNASQAPWAHAQLSLAFIKDVPSDMVNS
jgi:hypothetical protein